MKRKDKGISDQKLQDLTRAVSKLVAITTTDLNAIRERQQVLEDAVQIRLEALEANLDEVREVGFHQRNLDAAYNINVDLDAADRDLAEGRTVTFQVDRDDATKPYALVDATNLYVSGENPYVVARDLIQAAQDASLDPTSLVLSVSWEAGDEDEPSYFAGNIAAVV